MSDGDWAKDFANIPGMAEVLVESNRSYNELTEYIEKLDSEDGEGFLPAIKHMGAGQLADKLRMVESYALTLGFDEARAMQHGRVLDVLGARRPHSNQPAQAAQASSSTATAPPSAPDNQSVLVANVIPAPLTSATHFIVTSASTTAPAQSSPTLDACPPQSATYPPVTATHAPPPGTYPPLSSTYPPLPDGYPSLLPGPHPPLPGAYPPLPALFPHSNSTPQLVHPRVLDINQFSRTGQPPASDIVRESH